MPSDEIAVMTPMIHELKTALKESKDWCLGFVIETNDDYWIQVADNVVNLSMVMGKLNPGEVEKLFIDERFVTEIVEYEENAYLTIEINWKENTTTLISIFDKLFTICSEPENEYLLDCEIYRI